MWYPVRMKVDDFERLVGFVIIGWLIAVAIEYSEVLIPVVLGLLVLVLGGPGGADGPT